MAIGSIGTMGAVQSKTANQASFVLPVTAVGQVSRLLVLAIAVDNHQTTDGDEGEVTSITDVRGNNWLKARAFCNGQGSAQAGTTVAVWYTVVTTQLEVSDNITINFSNSASRDAAAVHCWKFTTGGIGVHVASGTDTPSDGGGGDESLALSGLSSAEYLFWRSTSHETTAGFSTYTSSYSNAVAIGTSGGAAATNQYIQSEFIIATATGHTSAPSGGGSTDGASVFIAFKEGAAPAATYGATVRQMTSPIQIISGR